MNSESYINRRVSNKLQIGFVRGGVSSNFKSGWLHYEQNGHREFGDSGRKKRVGGCCSGGAA